MKRLRELERENARLRKAVSDLTLEKVILKEAASGNGELRAASGLRQACGARYRGLRAQGLRGAGQHRSTQRKVPRGADNEARLTAEIIELAKRYGRYGYRRITALLRNAVWAVNRKRVERIWRREWLKVPQRQPKRGRLWLAHGSCIRLRPERPNQVWSYDFVEGRTHDGRKFRMLNVIDEFTRECLVIRIDRN